MSECKNCEQSRKKADQPPADRLFFMPQQNKPKPISHQLTGFFYAWRKPMTITEKQKEAIINNPQLVAELFKRTFVTHSEAMSITGMSRNNVTVLSGKKEPPFFVTQIGRMRLLARRDVELYRPKNKQNQK